MERGEVKLPDDSGLLAEMASVRYDYSPNGALRLEDKTLTKKRIMRSPDAFDAAMLGFADKRSARDHAALANLGAVNAEFYDPSPWNL